MKNNRYSISIRHALMLLVFLLGLPSSGFGFTNNFRQDGIWFQFVNARDKTVEVYGCDKTLAQDVVIPSSVNYEGIHYKVITIGDKAFYGCHNLTSIELPNSVTTIGHMAFYDCLGLISIELPNSVTTIDNGAFLGCNNLTSIKLPNSVTTIGGAAFENCIYNHRTTKTNQKYPSVNL